MQLSRLLENMNPQQQEGIRSVDGPVLLLAGAGSGKTRVITHRIAYLIQERGVPADAILAVTFTNKAAGEIRERISHMLGRSVEGWFLGTFHSLATRLLRPHAATSRRRRQPGRGFRPHPRQPVHPLQLLRPGSGHAGGGRAVEGVALIKTG